MNTPLYLISYIKFSGVSVYRHAYWEGELDTIEKVEAIRAKLADKGDPITTITLLNIVKLK